MEDGGFQFLLNRLKQHSRHDDLNTPMPAVSAGPSHCGTIVTASHLAEGNCLTGSDVGHHSDAPGHRIASVGVCACSFLITVQPGFMHCVWLCLLGLSQKKNSSSFLLFFLLSSFSTRLTFWRVQAGYLVKCLTFWICHTICSAVCYLWTGS